ncbi:MAG TPA: hypothetical protein VMW10_12595, partial [Alphaproteobacteria bacterium]|nr:hypothetical protein [Alphaproteobacteria bacterium]
MFKKFLGYLLILQHLNVYVLQAAPEGIIISFSRDTEDTSSKNVRLKLNRINDKGTLENLYERSYKFEDGCFKPSGVSASNQLLHLDGLKVKNGESLHISSKLPGHDFSLHLYENGRAKLLKANSEKGSLDLTTFGNIELPRGKGDFVKAR